VGCSLQEKLITMKVAQRPVANHLVGFRTILCRPRYFAALSLNQQRFPTRGHEVSRTTTQSAGEKDEIVCGWP